MIQRIQTLFLFVASALLFSLFFSNLIIIDNSAIKYVEYKPFLIFTIATFALSFIPIFLFKKRMLQMRFCIFNMILLIAYQVWIVIAISDVAGQSTFSITAVFPIIAGILIFLAFRNIGKDEALVQSMNSLRKIHKNRKR